MIGSGPRRLLVAVAVIPLASLALASAAPSAAAGGGRLRMEQVFAHLHVETPRVLGDTYIRVSELSDGETFIVVGQVVRRFDAAGNLTRTITVSSGDQVPFDADELRLRMDGLSGATLRGTFDGSICDSAATGCVNGPVEVDLAWTGTGHVDQGPYFIWRSRTARAGGSLAGFTYPADAAIEASVVLARFPPGSAD